ncbi:class I SAM-dependent methyltransferase [Dyadobacter sp. CY356]|uniref:class I SAM-dependent DNA methyltransferase n=1 Tax=Dyadobacter sp. CY356 TaxID=2906442 RepID=UPI001F3624EA|nr:SAM-dependent methyltransferase [Dyadobacter sp. CY356]MCF0059659.1 nodulation S family protein [Dyadobacter sp. CY356]
MEKPTKSLDAEFFNEMYQRNEDPWDFENSPYEREKYEATLAAIPNTSYENAFEIGCSNGILSEKLAGLCKNLLAVDASKIAIQNAEKRLADYPAVEVREMTIPNDFPDQKFDLILFSEVGYFLSREDLETAKDKMIHALTPKGHLLMVHWTPFVEEFPLTGDEVHDLFIESAGDNASDPLIHLQGSREEQYRLDLFGKKTEL